MRTAPAARWAGIALAAALAATGIAACSDDADRPGGGTPSSSSRDPGTTVKPLSYQSTTLWTAHAQNDRPTSPGRKVADTGLSLLYSVKLVGDTVLYSGITDEKKGRWVAVDAATGTVRWTHRSDHDPYFGAGHTLLGSLHLAGPHQETLLINYRTESDRGVLALSMKDGHELWKIRVADDQHYVAVTGATESAFIVQDVDNTNDAVYRTYVYDLASRHRLLATDDVDPRTLIGGTAFGFVSSPGKNSGYSPLVALDVRTGKEKWGLRDRYPHARVMGRADGALVISNENGGSTVLDPATGTALAHTGTHLSQCRGDAAPLLVCQADGTETPVVIDLSKHNSPTIRELKQLTTLTDYQATGSWFFARYGAKGQYRTMDARGRTVSTGLPGRPIINDKYVVFIGGIGVRSAAGLAITVHRR